MGVRRITAPRIDVVAPEVDCLSRVTAVKIVGHINTNSRIVIRRVANTHGPVSLGADVALRIADCSLNKCGCFGIVLGVGDLVASKEAQRVGVALEGIDHAHIPRIKLIVPGRVVSIDGDSGGRQVEDNVDAGVGKRVHACVMTFGRVYGIHADGVGVNLLKVWDISAAAIRIGKGVHVGAIRVGTDSGRAAACIILLVRNSSNIAGAVSD